MRYIVTSDPSEVRIQLRRAEYFSEKVLLRIPDDPALSHDDRDDILSLSDYEDKSQWKYFVHTYDCARSLFVSPIADIPGHVSVSNGRTSFGPVDRQTEDIGGRIGSWYQADTL